MPETDTFITGVDFVCIPTRDYKKSREFYGRGLLGLPFVKQWGNLPAGEFQAGNLTIAVMELEAFGQEFRTNSAPIAFQVPDVEAARKKLEDAGIEFMADTLDSGVCHQAFFSDPDGNTLNLHHRYAD